MSWNVTAHGPDGRWAGAIARIVGGVGAGDGGGLARATGEAVDVEGGDGDPVEAGGGVAGGMQAPTSRASASAIDALRGVMNPHPDLSPTTRRSYPTARPATHRDKRRATIDGMAPDGAGSEARRCASSVVQSRRPSSWLRSSSRRRRPRPRLR